MNVYVARQPILDIYNQVVAYELLFRNNNNNFSEIMDSSLATLDVIKNSFSVVGTEKLTDGKTAFINFDENLIKSNFIENLPKNLVIEILENIEPDKEIIKACKTLKEKGYTLALDDFIYNEKYKELINYVDIIKVDFIITKGIERKKVIELVNNNNIRFLAEKVETIEDYKQAVEYGYSLFQGYYFCKPAVITGKDMDVYQFTYLKLLNELNKEEIDIEKIEKDIKSDLSLSYKLLMLVNSAYYGLKNKITSIKKGVVTIGTNELKKWLYVITLKSISKDKPEEIVRMSLARAYFGELIIKISKQKINPFDMFLTGLLSMIDILTNREMKEVISNLPLSNEVKHALLGEDNFLNKILKLEKFYENADWEKVENLSKELGINKVTLNESYMKSIELVRETLM